MLQHPSTCCPGLQCRAVSDAIKPIGELLRLFDVRCSSSEHKESSLESILRILLRTCNPSGHGQHQAAMPPNQLRERIFIPVRCKLSEQFAVGLFSRVQSNPEQLS